MAQRPRSQSSGNIVRQRRAPEQRMGSQTRPLTPRAATPSVNPQSVARSQMVRPSRAATPQRPAYEEETEGRVSGPARNQQPPKMRIGVIAGVLLMFLAVLLDVSEFALDALGTAAGGVGVVIGYLKDIFTPPLLAAVFWFLGAPPWKGRAARKKMATAIAAWLLSLVPELGAVLPETTIGVAATIAFTVKEDAEKGAGGAMVQNLAKITRFRRSGPRS